MGLGKTLQSIALILTNPLQPNPKSSDQNMQKSTLVVAPLALIKQWEKEIKDRVSGSHRLRVCIHHGPSRTKNYLDLQKYDVVITTYQILASEHASSSDYERGVKVGCFGVYWYRVILDEAHSIKNRLAKSSKACYALRAKHRWCLTGTPMQNNLDELQSLIHFLQIKPYDDPRVWKEQITQPMKNGRGGTAIQRLQYFLKAVMKRRTKDILKKDGALNHGGKVSKEGEQSNFRVTERKIEEIKAKFSVEERKFYDRLEQRTDRSLKQMEGGGKLNYANALVLLLRLRQACNHPELVAGKLSKDKDALTVPNGTGQGSRKPKTSSADVDDITDLLGGLTVKSTNCEVCMLELSKKETAEGAIRCSGCEGDVVQMKMRKKNSGATGKPKANTTQRRNRTIRYRPKVVDSDDEEEGEEYDGDGSGNQREFIASEKQRRKGYSNKAGSTDDENNEGSGEWIGDEDTSVLDELDPRITRPARSRTISLDTSDEDDASEEGEEEDKEFGSSDEADLSVLVASTKTECLLKILHRETAEHKFIVFSQFTSMLDLIEPLLRRDGFNYTRYDGSMRNDQREASLYRLRNSPKCRILLCSLKCGSLGLNLTAASRVVILEPFWNPVRFLRVFLPGVFLAYLYLIVH
jgi:SNF2 family DNA or RNA helicase